MIDERHLNELLVEAGDELDRLATSRNVRQLSARPVRPSIDRRVPLLVAAAVVAIGVAALAVFVPDRAESPDDVADAPTSDAETTPSVATQSTVPTDGISQVEQVHVVESGDFLAGIASAYGVTIDEIASYNNWIEGANHPLFPGDEILIPPGALIPPQDTLAPPLPADLPYLVIATAPQGFSAQQRFNGPHGKDSEVPVVLLGWGEADDSAAPLTPIVVSRHELDGTTMPEARYLDDDAIDGVTGWIRTVESWSVGVFEVGNDVVSFYATSAAIPDTDLVAMVGAVDPDQAGLNWVPGALPNDFVELLRQDADAWDRTTFYRSAAGEELTFGTTTNYPLNGLTLIGESSARSVTVEGRPAVVIRGSTSNMVTAAVYWACEEEYRCVVTWTGSGPALSDNELIALAARSRPATTEEIALIDEM